MRRNTVRSLSHVRDFVASAFFEEEKGDDGAGCSAAQRDERRDRGSGALPQKCPKRAKYYISVVADWTARRGYRAGETAL